MDQSVVRKLVDDNVRQMCNALALQDWRIDVEYTHCEGAQGSCTPEPAARRAYIEIDASAHDDAEDVLATLRHELLHVVAGDLEIYRKAVKRLISRETFNALDEFFSFAMESCVLRLERAFDCCRSTNAEEAQCTHTQP